MSDRTKERGGKADAPQDEDEARLSKIARRLMSMPPKPRKGGKPASKTKKQNG